MAISSSGRACARFDRFTVDLTSGELLRSGVRVPVQVQPFQVLRLLLEAEGRVVTREEMRRALWPEDTFVDFDLGVNTAVKKLRQALEDSAEHPKFIETLPKYGYRFLIPVEWVADGNGNVALPSVEQAAPPIPPPAIPQTILPKTRGKFPLAIALAALGLLTAGAFLFRANTYLSHSRLGVLLHRVLGRGDLPQSSLTQRRLTANPYDTPVTTAVISPDGKYLAYTDSTGFYLQQVDNGETHPVPLPKGFAPSAESWLPDSVHLVVSWIDDAKNPPSLWQISIMGGTPRKLADEGSSARVSPDGTQVVFLKGAWDHEEIWLADISGNGARKIIGNGSDHFGPIAWAPDAKQFAYIRLSEHEACRIEAYDLTSGRSETVLSDAGLGLELAWPTAQRLIYSLQEGQPNQADYNLWWVLLDAHTRRPSTSPNRLTNDRAYTASISATSDGKRMAVLRRHSQQDVYLAELEGDDKKLSPLRRFTLDERQDFLAGWTPDSKAVLIVSDRDGPSHIFKQNIDQTQPELLIGGKDDAWLPRLTPDGSSVLYLVTPAGGHPSDRTRLMRMPLSGGPSQLVLEGLGIVHQCARLPSNVCIYGQRDSEYYRFFTFDPSDGKRAEISAARIEKADGMNNWNLSPDGRYLVTSQSQNPYEASGLRIFNLADSTKRYIAVPEVKLIMGLDWAADSKSVWVGGFMGRGSWGTRSGLVNVDLNGNVRTLLAGHNPEVMGGTPSPDGHRLAIGANTETSNAWLLANF